MFGLGGLPYRTIGFKAKLSGANMRNHGTIGPMVRQTICCATASVRVAELPPP